MPTPYEDGKRKEFVGDNPDQQVHPQSAVRNSCADPSPRNEQRLPLRSH